MRDFEVKINRRRIYVFYSLNKEERAELENLVRQTKAIERLVGDGGKTGMYVIDTLETSENYFASVTVGYKYEFSEKEIELLQGYYKVPT